MIFDNTENSMRTAAVVARRSNYPFWSQGDTVCKLLYDTVMVNEDSYQPLPLDSKHPINLNAILVEETPPAINNIGFVQYDRVYATVGSGFDTYGIASYEYPGIVGGSNTPLAFTSEQIGRTQLGWQNRGSFISVNSIGGVPTANLLGQTYAINYTVSPSPLYPTLVKGGTYTTNWTVRQSIVNGKIYYPALFTTSYLNFQGKWVYVDVSATINTVKLFWNRIPFSAVSQQRIRTDFIYTLDVESIPLTPPFEVPVSTQAVNSQNVTGRFITGSTVPNIESYFNAKWIQSEQANFTRWKGNIYRIDTPYVIAR
jgi:hypothetical protein